MNETLNVAWSPLSLEELLTVKQKMLCPSVFLTLFSLSLLKVEYMQWFIGGTNTSNTRLGKKTIKKKDNTEEKWGWGG